MRAHTRTHAQASKTKQNKQAIHPYATHAHIHIYKYKLIHAYRDHVPHVRDRHRRRGRVHARALARPTTKLQHQSNLEAKKGEAIRLHKYFKNYCAFACVHVMVSNSF